MTFTTRAGASVALDVVESWTVRAMERPRPAEGLTDPANRDQAALAIHDWTVFPFEVLVLTTDDEELYLHGEEARAFVQAQIAALTPWLQ